MAERCAVTRQSIPKWETDIALPETEKLLMLSEIFGVPLDTLLRDERTLNAVRKNPECEPSAIQTHKKATYEGILIKESLEDGDVIDLMRIHKVELWKAGGRPKYWMTLFFFCEKPELPKSAPKRCAGETIRQTNGLRISRRGIGNYRLSRKGAHLSNRKRSGEGARLRGLPGDGRTG